MTWNPHFCVHERTFTGTRAWPFIYRLFPLHSRINSRAERSPRKCGPAGTGLQVFGCDSEISPCRRLRLGFSEHPCGLPQSVSKRHSWPLPAWAPRPVTAPGPASPSKPRPIFSRLLQQALPLASGSLHMLFPVRGSSPPTPPKLAPSPPWIWAKE